MTEQAVMTPALGASPWTGEMEIPLINRRGFDSGTATARMKTGTVELWFNGRCQAVMVREYLREWMIHPLGTSLETDDVTWSLEAGTLCLTIGKTASFQISARTAQAFKATV